MPTREESIAALDDAIADMDDMPVDDDLGEEPPIAVVCQVCGTEVDTVTGEPVLEPDLTGGGEGPMAAPAPMAGGMPGGGGMEAMPAPPAM